MFNRGRTNPTHVRRVDLGVFTPMELVDLVFDRELGPQDEVRALRIIERDPEASEAMRRTQAALDALRTPVAAPDSAGVILEEVGARREWLAPALQRLIPAGRLALAAVLLAALGVGLLVRRANPDAAIFRAGPTPVANVVSAGTTEAAAGMRTATSVLEFVRIGSEQSMAGDDGRMLVVQLQSRRPCSAEVRAARAAREAGCASEALAIEATGSVQWFGGPLESKTERSSDENRWGVPPRQ